MANLSNIIPPVSLNNATGTTRVSNGGTGATSLTANNVLLGNGTSALQTVAPGASGNILTSNGTTWTSAALPPSGPTVTAVASGSLSDGSTVVLNSDGTVSVVASVTESLGSGVDFTSTGASGIAAVYDASSRRVIVAYSRFSNGRARVGTVSGTSISFGTEVSFNAASTSQISISYHAAQQKVVIAYRSSDTFGYVIAGTISGTSISFNSPSQFNSSATTAISSAYDPNSQRVVVFFQNGGNSNFGECVACALIGSFWGIGARFVFASAATSYTSATFDPDSGLIVVAYVNSGVGNAEALSVSGLDITFGPVSVFQSSSTTICAATYAGTPRRLVIAYNNGISGGRCSVGQLSGYSISFGTPVAFTAVRFDAVISATYNSQSNVVVVAGRNQATNEGLYFVGTVSGLTASFSAAVTFSSSIPQNDPVACCYDANANRVVISATDGGTGYGRSFVLRNAGTNLTTENFIGFSNAAYTNGQTATIQIVGSVDDAQSGLTPGRAYFVQNNGTLGLTPGTPSVFAGTAVSATRVIVKG